MLKDQARRREQARKAADKSNGKGKSKSIFRLNLIKAKHRYKYKPGSEFHFEL